MRFKTGDVLEDVVWELGSSNVVMAPERYDRFEGTDFWYCGIRCDVTFLGNNEKSNTIGLGSVKTDLMPVFVGVRTGNGHTKFSHPVCVISFNALLINGVEAKQLIETILTEELLDEALEVYWDGCDLRNIEIPMHDSAWSSLMKRRA